ncbi:Cell division protein SepF, partial [Dysosmobacter welbionis]
RPDGLVRLAGQGPPEPRPGGAGGRPAGAGGGYRFSPGGAVLVLLPVEGPEGPRQRPGGADHRGSAHLCVPGQRRRVERAEGVPAGQGGAAQPGGGRAAGLLLGGGPTVGQPPVRLGGPEAGRLRLVDQKGGGRLPPVRRHPHRPF